MNERSSRSHTIARIIIESGDSKTNKIEYTKRLSGTSIDSSVLSGAVKVSTLCLVDLAGSERVGHTGAEGLRLKEGAHINKSLLALGSVIAKLSESGIDGGHIPYRDSKLTRMLQSSLGGNSRTVIICTITLSKQYFDETISTLKFANRAKTITNQPEINEELRGDELLKKLEKIETLEKELSEMHKIVETQNNISNQNRKLLMELKWLEKSRDNVEHENGLLKEKISEFNNKLSTSKSLSNKEAQTLEIGEIEQSSLYKNLYCDFNDLKAQTETLQSTVKRSHDEHNLLIQENKKLRNDILNFQESHKFEKLDLANQILILKDEKKRINDEYEKIQLTSTSKNIELEKQLINSKSIIFDLEKNVDSNFIVFNSELKVLQELNNEQSQSLIKYQNEVKQLQEELKNQLDTHSHTIQNIKELHNTELCKVISEADIEKLNLSDKLIKLEQNNITLSEENSSLNHQIEQFSSNFRNKEQDLKNTIETLSKSTLETEVSIKNLILENQKQAKEYSSLENEFCTMKSALESKIDSQILEISDLIYKNNDLEEKNKILADNELKQINLNIELQKKYNESVNEHNLEINQLKNQTEILQSLNLETEQKNNKIVGSLQLELTDTISKYEKNITDINHSYQNQISLSNEKFEELELILNKTKNSNFESLQSINSLHNNQIIELDKQIEDLNSHYSLKLKDYCTSESKLKAVNIELVNENQDYLKQINSLNDNIAALQNEKTSLSKEIDNNIQLINDSQYLIKFNSDENNQKLVEIDGLKQKISNYDFELKTLKHDYIQLQGVNNLINDDIASYELQEECFLQEISKHIENLHRKLEETAELNQIKDNLYTAEQKSISLSTEIDTKKSELKNVYSKLSILESESHILLEKNNSLKSELKQNNCEKVKINNNLDEYKTRCNDLQMNITVLKEKLIDSEKNHSDLICGHNNDLKNLQEQISNKDNEIINITKERDENYELVENAKSMMVELVDIKNSEFETLQSELNNKIDILNTEKFNLESTISEKIKPYDLKVNQLESENKSLREDLLNLQQKLDITNKSEQVYDDSFKKLKSESELEIKKLILEIEKIRFEISSKNNELEKNKENCNIYAQNIEEKNLQIKDLSSQLEKTNEDYKTLIEFLSSNLLELLKTLDSSLECINVQNITNMFNIDIPDANTIDSKLKEIITLPHLKPKYNIIESNSDNLWNSYIQAIKNNDVTNLKISFDNIYNFLKLNIMNIYPTFESIKTFNCKLILFTLERSSQNSQLIFENEKLKSDIVISHKKTEQIQLQVTETIEKAEKFKNLNKKITQDWIKESELHNRVLKELSISYENLISYSETSIASKIKNFQDAIIKKQEQLELIDLYQRELKQFYNYQTDTTSNSISNENNDSNNPTDYSVNIGFNNEFDKILDLYQAKIDELNKQKSYLEKTLNDLSTKNNPEDLSNQGFNSESSEKISCENSVIDVCNDKSSYQINYSAEPQPLQKDRKSTVANIEESNSNSNNTKREISQIEVGDLLERNKPAELNHLYNENNIKDLPKINFNTKNVKKRTRRYIDDEKLSSDKNQFIKDDKSTIFSSINSNSNTKDKESPSSEQTQDTILNSKSSSQEKPKNTRRKRFADNNDYSPECAQQ
ncbi:hypothetical protein BB561_003587 [Smittium simulii]|uniref:Kinesin motor domain-containing protein n=1 Tax=Smittium simulii TaxID=133385 RepID=A0A2T9YKJ2_9FUNG|nr:hypothetical protein BB561_003587 [Smittium simulii]